MKFEVPEYAPITEDHICWAIAEFVKNKQGELEPAYCIVNTETGRRIDRSILEKGSLAFPYQFRHLRAPNPQNFEGGICELTNGIFSVEILTSPEVLKNVLVICGK